MADDIKYAVGDINSKERGTGARANAGKVALGLVPFHLLAGCCRVFMGGKIKYAPFNWAKGMPWADTFECLMRHLIKWWYLREDIDPESGEHHLDHVFCNLFMLRHFVETYKEGDDRPPSFTHFDTELTDFNKTFNEAEYLERNPAIKRLVEERLKAGAGSPEKYEGPRV